MIFADPLTSWKFNSLWCGNIVGSWKYLTFIITNCVHKSILKYALKLPDDCRVCVIYTLDSTWRPLQRYNHTRSADTWPDLPYTNRYCTRLTSWIHPPPCAPPPSRRRDSPAPQRYTRIRSCQLCLHIWPVDGRCADLWNGMYQICYQCKYIFSNSVKYIY